MGDVVNFPLQGKTEKEIEDCVINIAMKAGLSKEKAIKVAHEYKKEIHPILFDERDSILTLPPEVQLSKVEFEALRKSITRFHMEHMGLAANIIIGLLVRAELNSE